MPFLLPMRQNNALDFYLEAKRLGIPQHSINAKFGVNEAVTTTLAPIARGGVYPTPTALTSLEVVSSDVDDTAAGAGGQALTVIGIGTGWAEVSETVELDGTNAVALSNQYYRVYRAYISRSGTYAGFSAGSHQGTITIRESGGGATWAQIGVIGTSFGLGQSQIAAYTIPTGYTAIVKPLYLSIDGTKTTNLYFFQRPLADDVSTPYTGTIRMVTELDAISGVVTFPDNTYFGPFVGPCDIGWMGLVALTTASVSADFNIIQYESTYKSLLI